MALTLSRRILRFNFDPSWFVHSARAVEFGLSPSRPDTSIDEAASAGLLRTLGLDGRWCFGFDWAPARLALVSHSESEWMLPQLALLAMPEFRNLAVLRDDRDWLRGMPAYAVDTASAAGDVFRESGELKPVSGKVKDVRLALRRHGAALWLGLGQHLGEAGLARMRLMLAPTLDVPQIRLTDVQARLLHHGVLTCVGARPEEDWAWLQS